MVGVVFVLDGRWVDVRICELYRQIDVLINSSKFWVRLVPSLDWQSSVLLFRDICD